MDTGTTRQPGAGGRPVSPPAPGAGPGLKPLMPGMRWLLDVAAILVLAAGFQLFVFTGRTATYFAWTIHNPLAAAFLGASYWASVSIEALAARQRVWANARIAVPAVLAFTVLTLVATLTHLNLFHLGGQFAAGTRSVTWAWIAVYAVVPLLMLIVLVVQLRAPGADPPRSAPLPGWIYALLVVHAIVLLSLGVAMFTVPALFAVGGHAASWWPWTLTPLLTQATGAWLISLGIAAAQAMLERDARRLRPAAVGFLLLGVLQAIVLARYPGLFRWSSAAGVLYLVFLASMLVTGAAGLAKGRPHPPAALS